MSHWATTKIFSIAWKKLYRFFKVGGRNGIIWILIFMIPVIFATMIRDSIKNFLPDSWFTKTFGDLLTWWFSQWQLSLVLYSLVFIKLLRHPDSDSFCLGMEFFCNWTLSTRLLENKRTVSPECTNYRGWGGGGGGGIRGHASPKKIFWQLDSRKRHILHSLDRTQLIHTCILLSFCQSRVLLFMVQRFMIPSF